MKLDEVVPFGRSLDEYSAMFSLVEEDKTKKIIGVGDGPASFNVEMTALGHTVVSIDPLYQFGCEDIRQQFGKVLDNVISQVEDTVDEWVWIYHRSVDELRRRRIQAFTLFIQDYELGRQQGRYRNHGLPNIPMATKEFDLALCSHLLFLYSDQLDYQFHLDSILEMLRLAAEVRIFPLLTLAKHESPYIGELMTYLRDAGFTIAIEEVSYELQVGGNKMMRIHG